MTENYPSYASAAAPPLDAASAYPGEQQSTADVVKEQAADLGQSSMQAGKHAADVARQQASEVAAEAGRQGRDLLRQAQDQVGAQAAQGQQRLAGTLLSLSDELRSMADGSANSGMATGLARQAAATARDAGQWLDSRGPADVVDELQSFARRRPMAFLALALGAGLVAGRITRGIKSASDDAAPGTQPAAGTSVGYEEQGVQLPLAPGYPREPGAAGAAGGVFDPAGAAPESGSEPGVVEAPEPGSEPGVVDEPVSGGPDWDQVPVSDSGPALGDTPVPGSDPDLEETPVYDSLAADPAFDDQALLVVEEREDREDAP